MYIYIYTRNFHVTKVVKHTHIGTCLYFSPMFSCSSLCLLRLSQCPISQMFAGYNRQKSCDNRVISTSGLCSSLTVCTANISQCRPQMNR